MAADFNVKPLEPTLDFDHLRYWDVVIIGAGPAGLAASLTTAHRALTTLVIEAKGTPGGHAATVLRSGPGLGAPESRAASTVISRLRLDPALMEPSQCPWRQRL